MDAVCFGLACGLVWLATAVGAFRLGVWYAGVWSDFTNSGGRP